MVVKIEEPYGTTSREEIARFEARKEIALPDEYRRFLLKSNGGRPVPDSIDVPGWAHKATGVDRFFGLHSGRHSNLEKECDFWADRLPSEVIPIAFDQVGNVICLGITGERRGKLYLWDHEDEFDEHGVEGRQDYGNMYFLADTLGEFLGKLKE